MPRLPRLRRPGGGSAGGGAAKRVARRQRRGQRREKLKQIQQAFVMTRRNDRRMLPIVLATVVGVLAVLLVVGFLLGRPLFFGLFAVPIALLAGFSVFGRRAQRAGYAQIEGQPGAALAVVQSMRGLWLVTPVVAVTRSSDVVHRVLGRPGVILVGEGAPARLSTLLAQEKKRVGRVAAETPVYDVLVGAGDGQVELHRLQNHLTKLPRNLKPAQVRAVEGRLKALGAAQPPIPKGPLPRGARMPRGRPR